MTTITRRRPAAPALADGRILVSHVSARASVTRVLYRCRLVVNPVANVNPAAMPSPMKKVCKYDETDEKVVLSFAKLTEKAHAPFKGSEHAAGFDLKSAYPYVVKAHDKELVKTDIQIKVPHGTYGRIAPRSGLAWKNFIDVGAGVIDEDYRGNVGVLLFNHSDTDFQVNPGDRVAQLICEKIAYPELKELETLDETVRGEGGFGSTGTN